MKYPLQVDPYKINPNVAYRPSVGPETLDTSNPDYSFGELWSAQQMYYYDPIIDAISDNMKYGDRYDPNYNPLQDMAGYEHFAPHLIDARNADHMAEMKADLDENEQRRKVLAEASFGEHLLAGLLDPLNLVPFGGFGIAGLAKGVANGTIRSFGGYVGHVAVRTGLGAGAITGVLEAASAPFDPIKTSDEIITNIAFGTVFGGAFGGLLGIPMGMRASKIGKFHKAHDDLATTVREIEEMQLNPAEIQAKIEVPNEARTGFYEMKTSALNKYKEYLIKKMEMLRKGRTDALPRDHNKFKNIVVNIHNLGDLTLQKLFGKKYNVNRIVTNPEAVKNFKKNDPDGDTNWHGLNVTPIESMISRRGSTVYIDKASITRHYARLIHMMNDIDNNPSVLPKDVHDFLFGRAETYYKKKMRLLSTKYKNQPEKRAEYAGYLHGLYILQARKKGLINNVDDYIDFILFHELNHSSPKQNYNNLAKGHRHKDKANILNMERLTNENAMKDFIEFRKMVNDKQQNMFDGPIDKEGFDSVIQQTENRLHEVNTELTTRRLEESHDVLTGRVKDPYRYADSWWTNSWIFNKLVPTPMKNVLQDRNIVTPIKKFFVKNFGDKGMLLNIEKHGGDSGNSVYMNAKLWEGEWVSLYMGLMKKYAEQTNRLSGVANATQFQGVQVGKRRILDARPVGFAEFSTNANLKYIRGEKGADDLEQSAIDMFEKFYKDWEQRLIDTGLIGNKSFYESRQTDLGLDINKLEADIKNLETELKVPENGIEITKDFAFTQKLLNEYVALKQKLNISAEQAVKQTFNASQKDLKRLTQLGAILDKFEKRMRNTKIGLLRKKYESLANKRMMLKEVEETLESIKLDGVRKDAQELMFPRYWKRQNIADNRVKFEEILTDWYMKNPTIYRFNEKLGKYERVELKPDLKSAQQRAKETTDGLLNMRDTTNETNSFFGMGKSKHFKHRTLDIPNKLVTDFIETDPFRVMKAYTNRVAPRYEFALMNGNKTLDEVIDDISMLGYEAGYNADKVNSIVKDFNVMYERVVGTVQRDPDRWDNKIIQVLRDGAQLNYLGSAGFSTLPDMAKIMMEHDAGTIIKVLQGMVTEKGVRLNANEGVIAGEIIDIIKQQGGLRFSEELANDPLSNKSGFWGRYERGAAEAKNAFYMLNLLAPMTKIFKSLDSAARCHTYIDIAMKRATGSKALTKQELEYGSRYGISFENARRIKELVDDGTITKTNNGLWIANTEKWGREYADLVKTFRGNLGQGILNTVLMGTPADLPQIVDGRVFIPIKIARAFGMKEDPRVRGYAQMETGLLGMPFQFFSYSFAAMNKITSAYAQGQVRNKYIAFASAMGLGYMSIYIKSQLTEGGRRNWENMEWEDKFARAFDQSGLLALFSDLYYTGMVTSAKVGGPDLGFGLIKPKFVDKPRDDMFGHVSQVASDIGGAGYGWGDSLLYDGLGSFVRGEYGTGAKNIIKDLPFARLWFLKGFVNDIGTGIEKVGRF